MQDQRHRNSLGNPLEQRQVEPLIPARLDVNIPHTHRQQIDAGPRHELGGLDGIGGRPPVRLARARPVRKLTNLAFNGNVLAMCHPHYLGNATGKRFRISRRVRQHHQVEPKLDCRKHPIVPRALVEDQAAGNARCLRGSFPDRRVDRQPFTGQPITAQECAVEPENHRARAASAASTTP